MAFLQVLLQYWVASSETTCARYSMKNPGLKGIYRHCFTLLQAQTTSSSFIILILCLQ